MVSHMKTQEFLFSAIAGLFHFPIIQSENTNIFPPLPPRRDTQAREWSKRKTGLENSTIQRKKNKTRHLSRNQMSNVWSILASFLALHILCGSMSRNVFFIQLPFIFPLPSQCSCSMWFPSSSAVVRGGFELLLSAPTPLAFCMLQSNHN